MGFELVKWNKARQAIIEAKSIDEIKAIRDKAEALRAYAKQAGESLKSQNDLCEIKLRAERRAGEMLKETELAQGKRTDLVTSCNQVEKPILKDLGIDKHESHRWQKIADIPEKKFEDLINEIDKEKEELTEAFIINSKAKIDRELKIQKQKEAIKSGKLKLPEGTYEVIVIDPPWESVVDEFSPNTSYMGRTTNPYPSMKIQEIKNIKLPSSKDCVLWLWTTHNYIWDAKQIMDNWKFEYKGILVWNKESMGIGKWFRKQCEFCLLGVKGKPIWDTTDTRDIITEKRTSHSTKPETFYKMVEEICVGRKLDYFARKKREGWDVYGDEVKE